MICVMMPQARAPHVTIYDTLIVATGVGQSSSCFIFLESISAHTVYTYKIVCRDDFREIKI